MDENATEKGLADAISTGAKAAREIGKSRERTFAIGEGLVAMRSQCLIAMGKNPQVNDRSILKSGKYRELMGAALKRYPAYTLATVFKNDSTRLAYAFCAEYRPQIEALFAQEEVKNPGSTLRLTNPERIKSKFKALTDPPKKKAAAKAADREAAAQELDKQLFKLKEERDEARKDYNDLFEQAVNFDTTPADKLAEMLLDTSAKGEARKNRLRFIDLVVQYATGNEAKPKAKRERKAKFIVGGTDKVATYDEAAALAQKVKDETGAFVSIEGIDDKPRRKAKAKAPVEEAGGFAPGVLETIQGDEAFLQKVAKKVSHDKAEMAAKLGKRKRKAKTAPPQSGDEGVSPLEGLSDGGSPYTEEELEWIARDKYNSQIA